MPISRTTGNGGIFVARLASGLTNPGPSTALALNFDYESIVESSAPGSLTFVPAKIDHPAPAANPFYIFFTSAYVGRAESPQVAWIAGFRG
jgi:hypothetical protein